MPSTRSAGEGESGEASVSWPRAMHAHPQFAHDAIDRQVAVRDDTASYAVDAKTAPTLFGAEAREPGVGVGRQAIAIPRHCGIDAAQGPVVNAPGQGSMLAVGHSIRRERLGIVFVCEMNAALKGCTPVLEGVIVQISLQLQDRRQARMLRPTWLDRKFILQEHVLACDAQKLTQGGCSKINQAEGGMTVGIPFSQRAATIPPAAKVLPARGQRSGIGDLS